MRVFSKKNFTFTNPESKETTSVKALTFSNLPEWVQRDPLFGWAKKEGSLEVFGEDKPAGKSGRGKQKQKAAKLDAESEEPGQTAEAAEPAEDSEGTA